MKPFFYNVNADPRAVSYDEFLRSLTDEEAIFYPCLHSKSTYDLFKNLLLGILSDQNITLLDSEFTENEVAGLLGDYSLTEQKKSVKVSIVDYSDLVEKIENTTAQVTLFTSGTTGKPKAIQHDISVFLKTVRTGDKYKDHIWGLAYNPTHMAGLQVFFQALLNQNSIVKLFGLSNHQIISTLAEKEVTHLSATPTFYRLLDINENIESIQRITLGGEKSSDNLYQKLRQYFPNAKINNIYATTEFGTLFISEGDKFKISKENIGLVKIVDDLLYVHESLLSSNRQNIKIVDDWYCTNDKVEVVSQDPLRFRFIARVSATVNIGGYNVNPKETEDLLIECEGVRLARVFAKENRLLGNMLRAEVVLDQGSDLTEKDLINFVSEKLQPHKVPRIIKIVQNIGLTRTGKIKQ